MSEIAQGFQMKCQEPDCQNEAVGLGGYCSRRCYGRVYYRRNIEKARAYQRDYTIAHKSSTKTAQPAGRRPLILPKWERLVAKVDYFAEQLQAVPAEKLPGLVNAILSGEKLLHGGQGRLNPDDSCIQAQGFSPCTPRYRGGKGSGPRS